MQHSVTFHYDSSFEAAQSRLKAVMTWRWIGAWTWDVSAYQLYADRSSVDGSSASCYTPLDVDASSASFYTQKSHTIISVKLRNKLPTYVPTYIHLQGMINYVYCRMDLRVLPFVNNQHEKNQFMFGNVTDWNLNVFLFQYVGFQNTNMTCVMLVPNCSKMV